MNRDEFSKDNDRPETSRSSSSIDNNNNYNSSSSKQGGGKRIKSLMKEYRRKLQDEFQVFPRELLVSEKLDLHKWSFMIKDEALEYLADITYKRSAESAEEAARKEKEREAPPAPASPIKALPPGVTKPSRVDILSLARSQLRKKNKLLPQCSFLNINNSPQITDVGLQYIGESCAKSMKYLDIGSCGGVTDAGIRFVLSKCKNIIELNLSNMSHLQGSGLVSLGGLKCLTKLNLSKCM